MNITRSHFGKLKVIVKNALLLTRPNCLKKKDKFDIKYIYLALELWSFLQV